MLAFLGAGGAAAFASLFTRGEARAGHDGTNVLHLGEINTAPAGSVTAILGNPTIGPTLNLSNPSGRALETHGPAVMVADTAAEDTLSVYNNNANNAAGGCLRAETFGGPVAVRGIASTGFPDPIFGGGAGEGVQGSSGTGIGVVGITSGTGIGVDARSGVGGDSLDGIALNVRGKARFSTAGSADIPAGADSAFVPNPAVTGESHISVTLAGDPGPSHVTWVARSPGSGFRFTVHLSAALRKSKPDVPCTYLVVEPA